MKATKKGKFVFKAEAPDAIRSNAVVVSVKAAEEEVADAEARSAQR